MLQQPITDIISKLCLANNQQNVGKTRVTNVDQ